MPGSTSGFAAAQAVAPAVRDLGNREAAFDRLDLIRAALEVGGPVTGRGRRGAHRGARGPGLLIGDGGRMVTTDGAVRLEQAYLAQVEVGIGRSVAIIPPGDVGVRAQDAARELGLRSLNPGQEAATTLMLSPADRVVNVQGGPGRGKSAALAPVTAIAKAEGRSVIGLAIASRTARTLGQETGATSSTIAGFLARHARVIDGTASPTQVERTRAELAGAVVIVEEASQVGSHAMERLVRLANMMDVARLIQTGDVKQLGSVDAGKPFEQSQGAGHATAHITENLRSASDQMKAATAALDKGDLQAAFEVLRSATIEVERGEVAGTAARMWAALPTEERDQTLLLASGRAMRAAANAAVQGELKKTGEIAPEGLRMDVLDRVTVTREGARQIKAYTEGRVVEFRTDLKTQGFACGDRGVMAGAEQDRVRLRMRSGGEREFRPGKLPRNLKQDAVSVYAVKSLELHRGDRIRWTDNDRDRGLANADLGRVEEVGKGKLTVSSLADGTVHEMKADDRMLERLDLAYAINVHVAQGVTARHGIVVMSSHERMLSGPRSSNMCGVRWRWSAPVRSADSRPWRASTECTTRKSCLIGIGRMEPRIYAPSWTARRNWRETWHRAARTLRLRPGWRRGGCARPADKNTPTGSWRTGGRPRWRSAALVTDRTRAAPSSAWRGWASGWEPIRRSSGGSTSRSPNVSAGSRIRRWSACATAIWTWGCEGVG